MKTYMDGATMNDELRNWGDKLRWNLPKLKNATHELWTEWAWEIKLTEWVPGPTDKKGGKTRNNLHIFIFAEEGNSSSQKTMYF